MFFHPTPPRQFEFADITSRRDTRRLINGFLLQQRLDEHRRNCNCRARGTTAPCERTQPAQEIGVGIARRLRPESVASTRAAGRRGCGACAASGSGAGRKNLQASHFAAGRPRRAGSQLVASAGGELGIDALEARKCRTRAGKFQREPAPAFDDASRQIHQFLHYGPQSAPFCLMPDR